MIFEGLEAVEKFYKHYAHESGFGVHIGQQKKLDNKKSVEVLDRGAKRQWGVTKLYWQKLPSEG
jgi:hypothetical protein